MLDAWRERVKNSLSFYYTPERIKRIFSRRYMDFANALASGDLIKAGLKDVVKIGNDIKERDRDSLLKDFTNLEKAAETLIMAELDASKAEEFIEEKYIRHFIKKIKPIKKEVLKAFGDNKINKSQKTEIFNIITEISNCFIKLSEYILRLLKVIKFDRTQLISQRVAFETKELGEISFSDAREKVIQKEINDKFDEIESFLKSLNKNDKGLDVNKLVKLFKDLLDLYKREDLLQERYEYDLLTRVKNSLDQINNYWEKLLKKLKDDELDEGARNKIGSEIDKLNKDVSKYIYSQWQLTKSTEGTVPAINP